MRRTLVAAIAGSAAAGAMLAGAVIGPASAHDGPPPGPPPPHPHMLVLGLELDEDEEPIAFRRCVDLAAGRKLPLSAHHDHIHTGAAGEALFTRAGHAVVPGAPLTPWSNCAELIADLFGE